MERQEGSKRALVTGASSGIGRALVLALAARGMRVAGLARRRERLDSLAAEVRRQGGEFLPLVADLRREEDIRAAFEEIRRAWGGLDVLVNNAGLGFAASLIDGDSERWREMFEVNVIAPCLCAREALADMHREGIAGQIVNISSLAAYRVPPGGGAYSATKHALRALTEGLRQELVDRGSPVRVSAVSPGLVETEFAQVFHQSEAAAAETYGRYKVLEARDVAAAVLYILDQPHHVQVHDVLLRPRRQAM